MSIVNTSRAQEVTVELYKGNDIPLTLVYTDVTSDPAVAINITDYKFDFLLKQGEKEVATYSIDAGDTSSTYLSKTGSDHNILNMQFMWEAIRDAVTLLKQYTLVQTVTDSDGKTYVHIVYKIDARTY